MSEIAEKLQRIKEKINTVCDKVKRNPKEITLMAITKNVSSDKILEAYECGNKLFGENRVQEAEQKEVQLPIDIEWHMVGHLQTNKVREAVRLFKMVQSLDSIKLAQKLNAEAQKNNKKMEVLIEINVGDEATKSGFRIDEYDEVLLDLQKLESLVIKGLMTVAPFYEDVEYVRPYFKKMKELFDRSKNFEILSMGMSHDYVPAIEEGSTMVRLGEAIFGPRV